MNLQEKWKELKLKKAFKFKQQQTKPCIFDSCHDGHYLATVGIALKTIQVLKLSISQHGVLFVSWCCYQAPS